MELRFGSQFRGLLELAETRNTDGVGRFWAVNILSDCFTALIAGKHNERIVKLSKVYGEFQE